MYVQRQGAGWSHLVKIYLRTATDPRSRRSQQYVFAEDIRISIVDRGLDMIELGDEPMLEPVDDHFREYDRKDRLTDRYHVSVALIWQGLAEAYAPT